MSDHQQSLQDLADIRRMMEESSRFLSLSGLSGVSAGIVALIGAYVGQLYLVQWELESTLDQIMGYDNRQEHLWKLVGIALVILVCAAAAASFFTIRRTKARGERLWTKAARRTLINLLLPLAAGGIFCIQLAWYGAGLLVAPAMLIFYGLAVINAGKYTFKEIRMLGASEIVLGLIAAFYPGHGILFWAIGFGLFHILYGTIMYVKYER